MRADLPQPDRLTVQTRSMVLPAFPEDVVPPLYDEGCGRRSQEASRVATRYGKPAVHYGTTDLITAVDERL
ncbi:hypothetical protein ABTY20_04050 [Streptomyces sp. NPDC126497]|uniref:hypothetical protein n=1 Tax=Streptomyces sp. NPDC126497 TaxID=3155313 RepID=UPI0033203AA1